MEAKVSGCGRRTKIQLGNWNKNGCATNQTCTASNSQESMGTFDCLRVIRRQTPPRGYIYSLLNK